MDLEGANSNNGDENPIRDSPTDPEILSCGMFDDIDSNCSTPYVSAPSSPGRGPTGGGYFYSAPASPMHFALTSGAAKILSQQQSPSCSSHDGSFEFEFSARFGSFGFGPAGPSMSSADELFLNGQIRPMKLSTHLERPQVLAPLPDLETEDEEDSKMCEGRVMEEYRGRDLRLRDKSLRRRTRSMSPMRNMPFEWHDDEKDVIDLTDKEIDNGSSKIESLSTETNPGTSSSTSTPSVSASSSRSSSAGRSSKRWVFLKDFLRSKSEGSSHNKFWATISLKEKRPSTSGSSNGSGLKEKLPQSVLFNSGADPDKAKKRGQGAAGRKAGAGKPVNASSSGAGKRRVPPSPHELHYTANRAQAEELRKKTFLPYRQGLLGCLGFSSKGYGAMNGFARALNPVSSR